MDHTTEGYELRSSALDFVTMDDVDLDDQCWREIEAETGFSSYRSYLEAIKETEPHAKPLLDRVQWQYISRRPLGEVFVLDVLDDGRTVTSLEVPGASNSALVSNGHSPGLKPGPDHEISSKILRNLRSPPDNVTARVVLWSIPRGYTLHAGVIEALGLGLDIQPSFFHCLFTITSPVPDFGIRVPIGSDYIPVGDSIATVAQNYRHEDYAPPVLIIAGRFDLENRIEKTKPAERHLTYLDMVKEVVKDEIGESGSLYRRFMERHPPVDWASVPLNNYLRLLSKHLGRGYDLVQGYNALLLVAVLPLLHLETLRLRVQSREMDRTLFAVQSASEDPELPNYYRRDFYDSVDGQRFWLRRRIEGLEESRATFVRFVVSRDAATWLNGRTWLSQDAEIEVALAQARMKEAEVRDYMQLQIGNLTILESRKSIRLSNQQFDQAKRGRQPKP